MLPADVFIESNSMDQTQPFLVIDRPMRQMIILPIKEDAAEFLNQEERLWSWIDDHSSHSYGQINNVSGRYRADNWVQRFRNALSDKSEDFEQLMRQRYAAEQCLCRVDAEAQALQTLGAIDKILGVVALATLHGEAPTNDQNFMRDIRNRIGVAHGNALLAGIDPSIISGSKNGLMEAQAQIEIEVQKMRALLVDTKDEATLTAEKIQDAANALRIANEEHFSSAETSRTEAFDNLRNDLESTLRAFEVRMELQSPVAYWKKRANQYNRASRATLTILLIFAIGGVALLHWLYETAASHLPTDSASVPYAALFRASAFAVLMTSIVFWAGRVLLRIYLSPRHLMTDAEERRTMITTFLALTRKSALKDDDRKFILAALFRPGADGIVSEEAAPDTMFAALMGSILKK